MCGYTPFLDRSFTPESFNTLSRASSSWTHFVKRPYNHLALCGWCSTLRVGTCSTSVSTSMGSISPHSRDTLITSPRTLRVVLDSTRRHVLNLLLALPGFVSPQSRDPLSRLWVRLPPFPTSSSQKSSVLSLSRWHRSLCLRGALLDLLSTHLSLRERFGAFLWKASLLFFSSFSHATPITGLASKSLHCGREFASRSHQPLCT
jgi:hypothetical protein